MLIAFLLVLIYPDRAEVLPYQYKTIESCQAAAYNRRDDVEKFTCVKLKIELD